MSQNSISTHLPKSDRKDLKLALAQTKRQTTGTPGYRQYNVYEAPGTVAPEEGRPWLLYPSGPAMNLGLENGNDLTTENDNNIII